MGTLHIFMPPSTKIINAVLPLNVLLTGGNNRIKKLTINKKNLSHHISISDLIDTGRGCGEIKIEGSRTWRPIDLGINKDTRTLGMMVEYIRPDKVGRN